MRDLLPADMRAFRRVEDAFRAAAGRWGYEEVRTPTIETYSLFTAAGALTPQMLSRVYSFLDWDGWSGERVVLRPDSTIPVARAAAEASLAFPARLFYVQNVFRFSESDDREDWQCGLEYLGAPTSLGDLEVAVVGCETLESLGLAPRVRLSHAGISRTVAAALGIEGTAGRALLDRVGAEGLKVFLAEAAHHPRIAAFLQVATQLSAGPELLGNLSAVAAGAVPGAAEAIDEVREVASALVESGRSVVIDFGLPRDFEYYTGVVFEFEADARSWGRGGRYTPNGAATPGSACGLGLDIAPLAARVAPNTSHREPVAVIPAGSSDFARAMSVARALHRSGIAAALAGDATAAALSVTVSGPTLTARTPEGERAMAALEEVVGLLVQFK